MQSYNEDDTEDFYSIMSFRKELKKLQKPIRDLESEYSWNPKRSDMFCNAISKYLKSNNSDIKTTHIVVMESGYKVIKLQFVYKELTKYLDVELATIYHPDVPSDLHTKISNRFLEMVSRYDDIMSKEVIITEIKQVDAQLELLKKEETTTSSDKLINTKAPVKPPKKK